MFCASVIVPISTRLAAERNVAMRIEISFWMWPVGTKPADAMQKGKFCARACLSVGRENPSDFAGSAAIADSVAAACPDRDNLRGTIRSGLTDARCFRSAGTTAVSKHGVDSGRHVQHGLRQALPGGAAGAPRHR